MENFHLYVGCSFAKFYWKDHFFIKDYSCVMILLRNGDKTIKEKAYVRQRKGQGHCLSVLCKVLNELPEKSNLVIHTNIAYIE